MISEAESPLSVVAQQSRYLCEKLGNVFDGREAGLHVRNRDVYCSTAPCDIKSIPRLLLHPPHIHPKRPRPCLHQGVPPFSINPWEKPRSSWSRTRSLYTGTATNSDEGNCINTVCVVGYMLVYIYIYIHRLFYSPSFTLWCTALRSRLSFLSFFPLCVLTQAVKLDSGFNFFFLLRSFFSFQQTLMYYSKVIAFPTTSNPCFLFLF